MGSADGRRLAVLMGTVAAAALAIASGVAAQDASPAGGRGLLGATLEVFRDDMSTDGTWQLVEDASGVTAYDPTHQRLEMSVTEDRVNVWDDAEIPSPVPVIRVETWVSTSGEGVAGVACGAALGVPRWLWAGLDGRSGWAFGRMIDGRLTVVAADDLPLETGTDGRRATLAIECASDPAAGGDRVVITANDVVIHEALDVPVGPYDKGTLIVAADVAPVQAQFDDVVIAVGDAVVPSAGSDAASPAP